MLKLKWKKLLKAAALAELQLMIADNPHMVDLP
jgi:hypothetical protein